MSRNVSSTQVCCSLILLSSHLVTGCQLFTKSKTNTFVQRDAFGNIESLLLPYNDTIEDAPPLQLPDAASGDGSSTDPAAAGSDSTADTADAVTTTFKKMGQCWYLAKQSDKRKKPLKLSEINLSLPADQADAVEGSQLITKNFVPTPALIAAMKRDPELRNMRAQYDNTKQRLTEASQRNFSNLTSNPLYVATIGGTIASQAFLNDRLGNMSAEQLLSGKGKAFDFWDKVTKNAALQKFGNGAVVARLSAARSTVVNSAFAVFDKAHHFCFRNPNTARVMGLACVTALVTTITAAIQGSINLWTERTEKPPPLFKAEKEFLEEFSAAVADIEKESIISPSDLDALVKVGEGKNPGGVLRRLGQRPGSPCPKPEQAARNMRVSSGLEQ